jgi:hypothetical protein
LRRRRARACGEGSWFPAASLTRAAIPSLFRAATEAADPKAKAQAAAKANNKGTMKKKVLKKRFSTTFHRCAPAATA